MQNEHISDASEQLSVQEINLQNVWPQELGILGLTSPVVAEGSVSIQAIFF